MRTRAPRHEVEASLIAAGYTPAERKEPKRKGKPEDILHVAVRKELEWAISPPGVLSRHNVVWFSIESRNSGQTKVNAKTGKTFNLEGQARKARGCIKGVPDIHFSWPGGKGWIELKAGKNNTSDDQDKVIDRLRATGARVAVAWSVDDVLHTLRDWGVPLVSRRMA